MLEDVVGAAATYDAPAGTSYTVDTSGVLACADGSTAAGTPVDFTTAGLVAGGTGDGTSPVGTYNDPTTLCSELAPSPPPPQPPSPPPPAQAPPPPPLPPQCNGGSAACLPPINFTAAAVDAGTTVWLTWLVDPAQSGGLVSFAPSSLTITSSTGSSLLSLTAPISAAQRDSYDLPSTLINLSGAAGSSCSASYSSAFDALSTSVPTGQSGQVLLAAARITVPSGVDLASASVQL